MSEGKLKNRLNEETLSLSDESTHSDLGAVPIEIAESILDEAKREFEVALSTNLLHEIWVCYKKWFGE